jgi:hypothetical protein
LESCFHTVNWWADAPGRAFDYVIGGVAPELRQKISIKWDLSISIATCSLPVSAPAVTKARRGLSPARASGKWLQKIGGANLVGCFGYVGDGYNVRG